MTLGWNGKVRDRVGQGEVALTADTALDGTLTATVTGPGRTVKQLVLVATGTATGQWDTVNANGMWVLGAAADLDGTLYNNLANASVNFAAGNGGTFVVFASDWFNTKFVAGTTLQLTATFTDDTTVTATAVVPVVPTVTGITPGSGVQGTTVAVTVSGTNFQAGATLGVGPGVTVTNVTVASATQLLATLAVATEAPVGARDVTVTNPGGSVATLAGGFAVTAPGVPPPPPPPPPGMTLGWNGKVRDRVGQGEVALTADTALDGTLDGDGDRAGADGQAAGAGGDRGGDGPVGHGERERDVGPGGGRRPGRDAVQQPGERLGELPGGGRRDLRGLRLGLVQHEVQARDDLAADGHVHGQHDGDGDGDHAVSGARRRRPAPGC